MCSIGVGIAVVAAVLVIKALGTRLAGPPREGLQAERSTVPSLQTWHLNSPGSRALVFSQIPDNPIMASLEGEKSPAEGTHSEEATPFDDRYSLREHFASFHERFVGVARLIRRFADKAVKTEFVLPHYAAVAETELQAPVREATGSLSPFAGRRLVVAALSPVNASPAATGSSANSGVRLAKVRQASLSSPSPNSQKTAIYDISAQLVYLPNGRRLEAHSGLGSYMDDPRHVSIKRKGATPPNTYRLVMRENLFHGVRAIRLIPVGDSNMFGRDGILAHHYLLGPNGQSNGCVSFADYPEFLNAFLNGEIDRLVVVERLENPLPGSLIAAGWFDKAFKGMVKIFERSSGT
jgi:hypothetical protein